MPFFSISASEFVELYVGMGAMRVGAWGPCVWVTDWGAMRVGD